MFNISNCKIKKIGCPDGFGFQGISAFFAGNIPG
jgi:hypothetical protein